jgi:hypothetical protein
MAAGDNPDTDQRLRLDHSSFEKLLAAAWVLQCVHDQTHTSQPTRSERLEPVGEGSKCEDAAKSELQSVLQFSATTSRSDSWREPRTAEVANHGTLVKAPEIVQPAVRDQAHYLPTPRVTLTRRGLRAVGIATPIWLLTLAAALLFVQAWRHESTHSVQASRPSLPTVATTVTDIPPAAAPPILTKTALTTKKPAISKKIAKIDRAPHISSSSSRLESSHKQITDPATFFAVKQLSRFEIENLRRQAKYGDDSAGFALGMAYEVGQFVPQDCLEAARWVASAAKEGNPAAQHNLGLRYRDGDGVPVDLSLSDKWLHRAVAHRNKRAKFPSKLFASR